MIKNTTLNWIAHEDVDGFTYWEAEEAPFNIEEGPDGKCYVYECEEHSDREHCFEYVNLEEAKKHFEKK
jgi:hypothetical protein